MQARHRRHRVRERRRVRRTDVDVPDRLERVLDAEACQQPRRRGRELPVDENRDRRRGEEAVAEAPVPVSGMPRNARWSDCSQAKLSARSKLSTRCAFAIATVQFGWIIIRAASYAETAPSTIRICLSPSRRLTASQGRRMVTIL